MTRIKRYVLMLIKIEDLMAQIGFAFYRLFSSFKYFFFYFRY